MKKTILVILMAIMTATPCLAQEIEPEGIFSIEGTAWEVHGIYNTHLILFLYLRHQINFHNGKAYLCTDTTVVCPFNPSPHVTIIDTPVLSIALVVSPDASVGIYLMQPIGLGVFAYSTPDPITVGYGIGIMFKIEDNWEPSSE
jgi:hypothetical protein